MEIDDDELDSRYEQEFKKFHGALDKAEYMKIRRDCGCKTCDCDALSQDSYHKGCHTLGLHDQEDDSTNSTESGGLYDEARGPSKKNKKAKIKNP